MDFFCRALVSISLLSTLVFIVSFSLAALEGVSVFHMGTQPYEVTRPCDLSHLVLRAKPLPWVGGGEGKGPPLSCSQRLKLGGGGGAGNGPPRLDGVCLLRVGEQVPSLCPPPPGMEVPST